MRKIKFAIFTIILLLGFSCSKSIETDNEESIETTQFEVDSIDIQTGKDEQTSELEEDTTPAEIEIYAISLYNRYTEEPYDTIVTIEYLNENMPTFSEFNYPRLDVVETKPTLLWLGNDYIELVLESETYNFSSEELKDRLNGEQGYGYENIENLTGLKSMKLIRNIEDRPIKSEHYSNLFSADLRCEEGGLGSCKVNAYLKNIHRIIVTMEFGDGATSYTAVFVLDNHGFVIEKTVAYSF